MEEKNKTDKNSRMVILAVISLIVFVLILILFLYLIRSPALFGSFAQSENFETTTSSTTPSNVTSGISFDNSYLFASPLKAAVSAERIRITAYILDGQGVGVLGQEVVLSGSDTSLHIYSISPATDESGRATFDITSDKAGSFQIEASVKGRKLNQKVNVTFN